MRRAQSSDNFATPPFLEPGKEEMETMMEDWEEEKEEEPQEHDERTSVSGHTPHFSQNTENSYNINDGSNDSGNDHDDGEESDNDNSSVSPQHAVIEKEEVLQRIEQLMFLLLKDLEKDGKMPHLEPYHHEANDSDDSDTEDEAFAVAHLGGGARKYFNLQQCRSMTSIVMVLAYCHNLLLQGITTTVREVYYFYVTHFRNQKEADAAIEDAATLLKVQRHDLNLSSSPKGWFCGDLQITKTLPDGTSTTVDARAASLHGSPIDSTWIDACSGGSSNFLSREIEELAEEEESIEVSTHAAQCILVVEKEGIYKRLTEDRFFDKYPCIIVTAKGFPDIASRAMVCYLHKTLKLPVWGLCDCNPFGILVMHTYFRGSNKRGGQDGATRYGVPIQWMGLRPSQVEALKDTHGNNAAGEEEDSSFDMLLPDPDQALSQLPPQVFQELTPLDRNRLENTLMGQVGHDWADCSERRLDELELMNETGYKVELEALHWLGLDFFNDWLGSMFEHHANGETGDDGDSDGDNAQPDVRDII